MGDMGELFKAMQEDSKLRRQNNAETSIRILKEQGFKFQILSKNGPHLRIENNCDFWPSTGLFCFRKGKKGRGVFNLIKELKRNDH